MESAKKKKNNNNKIENKIKKNISNKNNET